MVSVAKAKEDQTMGRGTVTGCVDKTRLTGRHKMRQFARIISVTMLVTAIGTTGYAQSGAMNPDQMRMMGDHMRMMSDQMKGGKMSPERMKMMSEHMQMMADRMKNGQMTADEMKVMREHMGMMREQMKGKK